jgi:hypothetical protein
MMKTPRFVLRLAVRLPGCLQPMSGICGSSGRAAGGRMFVGGTMRSLLKRWRVRAFMLVFLAAMLGVSWTELSRKLRNEMKYDKVPAVRADGGGEH